MVVVIQDLILQLHAVSPKSREGTCIAIVTFIVTDMTTAVQIYMRLTASVSYNTYAIPAKKTKAKKKTAPVVKEPSLQQSCKLHRSQ